ncbi:MAG: NAD-dependent epimerase/dehydratase family protein [Chloroflexota bacterium]|nr:NAD-dependent epimerase/dehydratase family protein [Chloroflexota bacterium]NCA14228.1 NAD-dependent epimerase/dehydratase family protein [Pseudomonadota bacterium]
MRVLITGGAGFIGGTLARAHRDRGDHVVALDSLVTGVASQVPDGIELVQADIRDPDLPAIIRSRGPFDLVSHHAALKDVRLALLDPRADADVNVLGTLNVIRAAVDAGAGRLTFASSAAVYGDPPSFPTDEDAPIVPISPYGIGKYAGELYGRYFAHARGLPVTAFRYGTVFGTHTPEASEAGVIAIFARRIVAGEGVVIYGDGLQTRDFVHVDDIVRANLAVADASPPDPFVAFNVATGVETSVVDLASHMGALVEHPLIVRHEAAKAGEVRRNRMDASRLHAATGWVPQVDMDSGLVAVIDAARERFGA